MEKLKLKLETFRKTLVSLEQVLQRQKGELSKLDCEIIRDSTIQRFKFSLDTCLKFLKEYIQEVKQVPIDVQSPRAVFRKAVDLNIIASEDLKTFFDIIEDRNRTSHTYWEELAEKISLKIPFYKEKMAELATLPLKDERELFTFS